jgi:lysozyme
VKISQQGLDLIKHYEQGPGGGCALESYVCNGGVWTIGWGHTKGVRFGQHATEDQCRQFLLDDVAETEATINRVVRMPLVQHQFDALVALVFNIGSGNFFSSTLRKKLNAGDYEGAAEQFGRWNISNSVTLKGLVRRRADETKLFLTGSY